MLKKRKAFFAIIILVGIFTLSILTALIQNSTKFNSKQLQYYKYPSSSADLEGFENILITKMDRTANISGYGVVNCYDNIEILNKNNNPITTIFFATPLLKSDDLIFFKAIGNGKNSLTTERAYYVMNNHEMIAIYLDTPLLPQESTSLKLIQTYKDFFRYELSGSTQNINCTISPFPIFPYKAVNDIKAEFFFPSTSEIISYEKIGITGLPSVYDVGILYELEDDPELNFLEPFLENLNTSIREISFVFEEDQYTQLEMIKADRKIFISPWGIMRVKEDFTIQNLGVLSIVSFSLKIPLSSLNIHLYDEIGDLEYSESSTNKKSIEINLAQNRAPLIPSSKYRFFLEYDIPVDDYVTTNWLQQSVKIDLQTTTYQFICNQQSISLIIEGCDDLDKISSPPESISDSSDSKVIIYSSEYISPLDKNIIFLTFSINIFDLILRPISISLIIVLIGALFVIITKMKAEKKETLFITKEFIPSNEIREFCSLYEEKNALILELRRAENEVKRRKISKKVYSNLKSKNSSKIQKIKNEITPFKEALKEVSENFTNIINKLDVLDAERVSVEDSINLLENRYKRGKLPSKAAYQKLLDDFTKRRRRIDKTIDKYIQQLRSYLL